MTPNSGIDYTASWTQIANRALGRLGAMSITDLGEGTKNAEYCGRFLGEAVEFVPGQSNFKFARKRIRLAPNTESPAFGLKRQFNLPMDFIRLVKVYGTSATSPDESEECPYQVENGRILADKEELEIIYIARPDDPNTMPQAVRQAISTKLAALLSTPLTSNEQLIALIMSEAERSIALAISEDNQMNHDPDANGQPYYIEARHG
jgi:hypothetical protein